MVKNKRKTQNMKKSKILMPIITVVGLTATVTPLVCLTSCSNPIKLELTEQSGGFLCSGTFEKGSFYEFTIDTTKWTTGKPTEAEWPNKLFEVYISSPTESKFLDIESARATMNGNKLEINSRVSYGKEYSFSFNSGVIEWNSKLTLSVKCTAKFDGVVQFRTVQ